MCVVIMSCSLNLSTETKSGTDNRGIMDDGASQELTEETIAEMKDQGASGQVHPWQLVVLCPWRLVVCPWQLVYCAFGNW